MMAPKSSSEFAASFFSAIARQRRVAIGAFVLLACAVSLFVAFLPNQYEAEMKLLVNNDRPGEIVTPGANSQQAPTDVDETQINSEIQLMTGNGLLERVGQESAVLGNEDSGPLDPVMTARRLEKGLKYVKRRLDVQSARKSDIIEVRFTDRDPERAKLVLTRLLADFLDTHTQAHATPGSYAFFRLQTGAFQRDLLRVEAELAAFEANGAALDLPEEESLLMKEKGDAETAMRAAQVNAEAEVHSLMQGERLVHDLPSRVATDSRSTPNQYSIERMRTLLVELRNKRADLLTNFPESDRQVQDLERQIGITETALNASTHDESVENSTGINPIRQAVESDVARTSLSLAAERARSAALQAQVSQSQRRLASLASVKQRYEQLERSRKELEDDFLLYSRKQEEARVTQELDKQRFSNINVVEAPLAFYAPSQPKVLLDLALGWSFAACMALVLAVLADRFFDGIYEASTLQELTGLPVLGITPAWR